MQDAVAKLEYDTQITNLNSDYKSEALQVLEEKHSVKIKVRDTFKNVLRETFGTKLCIPNQTIAQAYQQIDQRTETEKDIVGRIKKKQEEFEDIYQHSKGLTDDAKQRANNDMNQVSQEIKRLRSLLAPQDRAVKIEREIAAMRNWLESAAFAVKTSPNRQKAQSLEKVVSQIICRFDSTTKHRKRKTIISEIEIVPIAPDENLFRITENTD